MAKLKIVTGADNPILLAMSGPVKRFDTRLKKLVKDMKDTMIAAKGLGIAAPQVGVNERVFIVTLGYGEKSGNARGEEDEASNSQDANSYGGGQMVAMVNPEITWTSEETEVGEEGCLSLPGRYGKVERASGVRVEFFDEEGARRALELSGLDARVVQHEKDHLDGVLFISKLVKGEKEEDVLM